MGDDLFHDTGHRLNLRVCVCSIYFSRMRNIIMAGPSTHLQFVSAWRLRDAGNNRHVAIPGGQAVELINILYPPKAVTHIFVDLLWDLAVKGREWGTDHPCTCSSST